MSRRSLLPFPVWRQRIKPYMEQYIGQTEVPGEAANPVILSFLTRYHANDISDEVRPWCAIFVSCVIQDTMPNYRMPRLFDANEGALDRELMARTWLVFNGYRVPLRDARQGDILVFQRLVASPDDDGRAEVHGHVAFFSSFYLNRDFPYENFTYRGVRAFGGNQGDPNPTAPGAQGGINLWGYKFQMDGTPNGIDLSRTIGSRLIGVIRMV